MNSPLPLERSLTICKEYYEKHLEQEVNKKITPKYCLVFAVPLRFQLPFKNETLFFTTFNNQVTAFIFDKYETPQHEAIFPDSALNSPELRTRVEAMYFMPECDELASIVNTENEESHLLQYSFLSHLLNRLNNYVNAYRMMFEDCKAFPVSPEQYFYIFSRVYDLTDWKTLMSGPVFTSSNPFNYEKIMFNVQGNALHAIEGLGMYVDQKQNKFVAASQFFAESRRYLYTGYPRETIVFLGMCSETMLNGLFHHIRKIDGLTELEINTEFDEVPFMRRIKNHISHSLGGSWDMSKDMSIVGKWKKNVYDLRNRVVHAGYFPHYHEAANAFQTMVKFSEFIRERVDTKKSLLPNAYKELKALPEFFVQGVRESTFDIS
ncbi:hypothetical protein [Gimesia algae]|uniref:Uncharacterized protein n=1 Tax=Gimesia algae TaxID=2527971 RepID=A0A517VD79_9PLAN|nr:hypothetical protein [Gimesia algae]QDT90968.1 hypothetical protein Pan161_26220 [Gimesia algae]